MTTIHDAYINALLADATYALEVNGPYSGDDLKTLVDLNKRMTPTLATFIGDNFSVLTHLESNDNDPFGSGFDATVWRGKDGTEFSGKTYVSMQGTQGFEDFLADIDLTVYGAAVTQIETMVNWWLKNTAPSGQGLNAIQIKLDNTYSFSLGPSVAGTGILSNVSSVIVNGHSLGGHLATAFARIFGGQAGWSVEHTYTYNSAGFTPTSDWFFKQIEAVLGAGVSKGYFDGVVGQSNFFAENGINVTTQNLFGGQQGLRASLFNEESTGFPNHYMYKLTDALALGDALAKLDSTFDTTKMNTLFDKGANKTEASLEGILDGLRKSILGDNITETPIGDVSDSELSRKTFYENLKALTDSATFQSLIGNVTLSAPATSATGARSDFGAFLSLHYLTPFVLKANTLDAENALKNAHSALRYEWEADNSLTPDQRANGEAVYSDMYLNDRAAMLSWVVKRNKEDNTYTILDTYAPDAIFIDKNGGVNLSGTPLVTTEIRLGSLLTGDSDRRHFTFGSKHDETITGGDKNDHLYGMSGDDTLNGGKGNDWLEGASGDDTLQGEADNDTLYGGGGDDTLTGGKGTDYLYGGEGSDTYIHNDGDGNDVIVDSDGSGKIQIKIGLNLEGGKLVKDATDYWESADKKTHYALLKVADGTQTLVITLENKEKIYVKDWENDELGIRLKNADSTPPASPAGATSNHDYIKLTYGEARNGLSGNDVLVGGGGDERLYGGVDDDILFGNAGDDVLDGGDGNDYISAGSGKDVIYGGKGNDLIEGYVHTVDILIHEQSKSDPSRWDNLPLDDEHWRKFAATWKWEFESGKDGNGHLLRYVDGSADSLYPVAIWTASDPEFSFRRDEDNVEDAKGDVIYGGDGDDAIYGGVGDNYISGDAGNDVITSSSGDDIILGGADKDEVNAGAGDDVVDGGTEDDSLIGHYGNDVLYGGDGDDELSGDLVELTSTGALPSDTDYSKMGNDILDGGRGDDDLSGGGGDDILFGGEGDDELSGDGDGTPGVYQGEDTLDGGDGDDRLWGYGGKDTLYGGKGNDHLEGDYKDTEGQYHDNDFLDGGAGNDELIGGGGEDTLLGGDGNDVLSGDLGANSSLAEIYQKDDYLDGGAGDDALYGDGGNDTLIGGAGRDYLDGGKGNDTLIGGGEGVLGVDGVLYGGDFLKGGLGDDSYIAGYGDVIDDNEGHNTIILSSQIGTVDITDDKALLIVDGVGIKDGLTNSSIFFKSADGVEIALADVIADKLDVSVAIGTGTGTANGGTMGDVLYVLDTALINTTLNGAGGNDVLTGGARDDTLKGGTGDDTLIGGVGNDSLIGGIGVDYMAGGVGDDVYQVDSVGDSVIESFAEGADRVESAVNYLLGSNVEDLTLTGDDSINGTGNDVANRIIGNVAGNILNGGWGNDTLEGMAGDDELLGGAGDDILMGGTGNDTYTFDIGDGFDVIEDTQGLNQIRFGAGITRDSVHASQYQGNDGSYYLQVRYGIAGDKVAIKNGLAGGIQGYQFADGTYISHAELIGGEGVPFHIYGTQSADTLVGTSSGDVIEGNAGDDVLLGLDGDDILVGGSGSDILIGSMGDDELDGGLGHDQLEGGAGQDSYLMYWGMGLDTLTEVSGSDMNNLKLNANITVSDLTYQRVENDLNLYLGANNGVQIKGYFNGDQQWQIVDDQNNAISVDDFIATPVLNDLSTVQQLMNKYQKDMKAQYYSELGQAGYVQGVDGKFTKTEYTSGSSYSQFDYHINDFVIVNQQSNDMEILAYNDGSYFDYYYGVDFLKGYKERYQPLSHTVTRTAVYTGAGSSSSFSTSGSGSNTPIFIPTSGGGSSQSVSGYGSSPYVVTNGGVWYLANQNGGGSSAPASQYNYFTKSEYQIDGTQFFVNLQAGDSTNSIITQASYSIIDAGEGDDQINISVNDEAFLSASGFYPGTKNYAGSFLYGNAGDDVVYGRGWDDVLIGGAGTDYLDGRSGADTYLVLVNDDGIDLVNDSGYMEPPIPEARSTGYQDWYYRSIGINDWESLKYELSDSGQPLLPPLPVISSMDYEALAPLYAAGVIQKDTIEFGAGIALADLSFNWGQSKSMGWPISEFILTLDISWGVNQGVRVAIPLVDVHSMDNSEATGREWFLGAGIEQFKFADGTLVSMAQMIDLAPPMPTQDPIMFDVGSGQQSVSYLWKTKVTFGINTNPADIIIGRDGFDLLLSNSNGVDQLRIQDWYADTISPPLIEASFSDGTRWSSSYLADQGAQSPTIGTGNNDVLTGLSGHANHIFGMSGDDQLIGGNGEDTLIGGEGNDIMIGGLGDDYYEVDSVADVVIENIDEGEDWVSSSVSYALSANVEGLELIGIDAINGTGNELDNSLSGNGAANVLNGVDGNDYLYGGLGDDILIGGAGDDTYSFSFGDGHDQIDNAATDNVTAIDKIYLQNIDPTEVVLSRIANDLKVSINAENSITIKNYYSSTDSKVDQIQFYFYDANTDTYTDTIWDSVEIDARAPAAEINHAPTIIGGLSDVSVIDGSTLSMILPVATLFEDSDIGDQLTYTVTSADGSVLPNWLSFNPSTLSISGTPNGGDIGTLSLQVTATDIAGVSAYINFNLSVAAMADQVLTGTSGNDMLTGGSGNDTLNGLAGADTMRGGYGNDSYYVDRASDKVFEDANQGADTINSTVTYTLSANVENLVLLGATSTTANGNELDNQLTGNAGNNTLDGKAGKDQMVGGLGNDTYVVDDIGDVVTEFENEGTDTVKSSVDYVLGDHVERLTLTGTEAISGTGNDLNNILIGNDAINQLSGGLGNDNLNGGLGADILVGGLGNDIYVVDDEFDTVIEQVGEGTDTIQSSVTYTLSAEVENLTLTGTSVINGSGNELNNTLTGNAADNQLIGYDGNDSLNGGLGADIMMGGLGNDTYTVDDVGDLVVEQVAEGIDKVNSSIDYVLGANLENLTLTGASAINGTGNELNNTITGNAADNQLSGNDGNDSLNGGLGADIMIGGLGNDIYTVDNVNDIVVERDNEGADRVNSSISYALGDYLENLTLTGSADINGFGNQLSNVLTGNTGHNYLFGLDGNDTLTGNTGNDVLQGGEGADILNSNAGNDVLDGGVGADKLNGGTESDLFVGGLGNDIITTGTGYDVIAFNKGDGQDIINASTGADNTLTLGGNFAYGDLSLTKSTNNLILKMGATDQITLKDWYLGTTNKSVVNLQVITEAMTGFSLGGSDVLRDNKVENFNFANLVAAFDAAGAIANWQLTDARLTTHLQTGSDTAAIGGDLAYQYGKNSNLTGMGVLNAQSVISAANFGQTAQTLNNPSVWQAELVKLG